MAWVEALDTAIYYEATGSPRDRPVLFLHELGGSHESWSSLVGLLDSCHCVSVDLPGAGRSEKRQGNRSLVELAAVMRALMIQIAPGRRWNLVGSALGSFVALVLARDHPELIETVTVCAVVPTIDAPTGAYLRDRVKRIEQGGMAAVTQYSLANSLTRKLPLPTDAFRRDYEYAFRCQDPDGYGLLSLALADFEGGADYLAGIGVPALVMAGAHDFIWPPALVKSVAAAIPGAAFHVLEDGGHFAHVQCPQSFAVHMREFWQA